MTINIYVLKGKLNGKNRSDGCLFLSGICLVSTALAARFGGVEHFMKFQKWHYEEQLCDFIFNLDQWFRRRCCLMIIIIYSFGGRFVWWSRTN